MKLLAEHNIYISQSYDPHINLSIENWLFRSHPLFNPILFLWRNSPSVIIGRAQNPWLECDMEALKKNNIPLVRRQSGGGTVYHDLGNLNYTFICPKENYNKIKNLHIIISALKSLNIEANRTQRNDIVVEHNSIMYKVSGCAFRESKDRAFHHGTLLINADTKKLTNFLHHTQDSNINAKGVSSVRSHVINLGDINHNYEIENYENAIIDSFIEQNRGTSKEIKTINPIHLNIRQIKDESIELKSWEWTFGKTLPFNQTLNINDKKIILTIRKGLIDSYNMTNPKQLDIKLLHTILKNKPAYSSKVITRIQEVLS